MAANTSKLTAAAIKAARPGKLFDGGGMFLLVKESGARYWQMKYRHGGKERLLSFGVYPRFRWPRHGDDAMGRAL